MVFPKKFRSGKEPIYFASGCATNKHWLVNIEWLNSIQKFFQFKKKIERTRVEYIQKLLLENIDQKNLPIESLLENVARELPSYSRLESCENIMRLDKNGIERVRFLKLNGRVYIDVNYAGILFADNSAIVLIGKPDQPLALLKNQKIMALLMPCNIRE